MYNPLLKKILSVTFFLLIILILFLNLNDANFNLSNKTLILFNLGIFISALFLLILNLIGPSNASGQDSQDEKSEKEKKQKGKKSGDSDLKPYITGIQNGTDKANTLKDYGDLLLKNLAKEFYIVQGMLYTINRTSGRFEICSSYAYFSENKITDFGLGDGICGQVAQDKTIKMITDMAEDYITVLSGLGSSSVSNLLIIPFVYNNQTIAVVELAAFDDFPDFYKSLYQKINKPIAEKFNALIK
jgi:putative methionine-R-sulfoxide reductase with GAF domain